jgi:preprotein translocase subunit SecD
MLAHLLDRRRLVILLLVVLACAGLALAIAIGGRDYSGPAQGATAIEYGLIAALIAVAAIA